MSTALQKTEQLGDSIAVIPQPGTTSPALLIQLAVEKDLDLDKLERLMDLQERWQKEEARKNYFAALSGFQSELPIIKKLKVASFPTKTGGQMTYNYASIDDITEQIKPYLAKFGLSYRFAQKAEGSTISIKCIVSHKDGHSESCMMQGDPDSSGNKNVLQRSASTVTYLSRYSLCGAFGISTADADIDGRLPEQPKDDGDFTFYQDHLFIQNFPAWEKAIKAGKISVDGVINKIQSKATLTDEQLQQIKSINA